MDSNNVLRVYLFSSKDPYVNLQAEDYLLRSSPDCPVLVLWMNKPCVVLGKFQNPWTEINLNYAFKNKIEIVRRQSGGGCVYQDLGNLNYTFIAKPHIFDVAKNLKSISDVLIKYGIHTEAGPRHDLFVDHNFGKRKISGSAFKKIKGYDLHHGTLLIDANLDNLDKLLLRKKQIEISTKAIPSVRSQVLNLKELNNFISIKNIMSEMITSFSGIYQLPTKISEFPKESLKAPLTTLENWDYVASTTPDFEWTYNKFNLNLLFKIHKNIIVACLIERDGFAPQNLEYLQNVLLNSKFDPQQITILFNNFFGKDFDKISRDIYSDIMGEI